MGLTAVDREYLKVLKPELAQAIKSGEPGRAAAFARELARLRRKAIQGRMVKQGAAPQADGGEAATR